MSTTCHLFSEHDTLRITADGEGAVWIRSQHVTVSLTLNAADLAKLRSALNGALADLPVEAAQAVQS